MKATTRARKARNKAVVVELMPRIGAEIAARREAAERSAADVAREAGVSVTTLRKVEDGAANTTIETLIRIALALDVDVRLLLSGANRRASTRRVHRRRRSA